MSAQHFGPELTADGARFRLWAPAAKRVDLLRTVRSEAAPAEQGMPLSMQLVEQLTSDLTAFQRRFMLAGRDDAEDAA